MTAIDLRSDTVTKPTPAMLEAMMSADVGDDVWNEDPTVRALELKGAALFGKEEAVFCPSGTMTNQIAIRVHTRPGDEVICSSEAHIYNYEGGGIAANSGASVRLLGANARGRFGAEEVKANIQPDDPHAPRTALVSVEDTLNRGGGAIWERRSLVEIGAVCRQHGLRYHLDGARVFNRLVATGDDSKAYGAPFDSISICLSKGLGAPVGSLLLGGASFIHSARRMRKLMGGGMRQTGYLAAAGIYALDHHVERLSQDHLHARQLAQALERSPLAREVIAPETNIVLFRPTEPNSAAATIARLKEREILCGAMGPDLVRFVTHLDVSAPMIEAACARVTRS